MRRPLPFVFLNVALSADGKLATANHAVTSPGSKRDLEHLYELRTTADAIVSGARTIEKTGAILGNGGEKFRRARLRRGQSEYPLRIIVSGSGAIDTRQKIFQRRFSPLIILVSERAPAARVKKLQTLADEVHVAGKRDIDWPKTLRWLQEKWGVKRLLCEGGSQVNGSLFDAGVVNEVHITLCPKIFGGSHAPTLADALGAKNLAAATPLKLRSTKRSGDELFLVYTVPV